MKNYLLTIALSGEILLTSCTIQNQTRKADDDVYYSAKDAPEPAPAPQQQNTAPSDYTQNNQPDYSDKATQDNNSDYSGSSTQQPGGNTYVTNNYYNNDDYYDYSYSSRIRRFYYPSYYSYYDPYYTNLYWYDYNPFSWGISIYLGYNWWAPSYCYYSPFCYGYYSYPYYGWGWSFGWGYYPYGNNYGYGYNNGYWNGYNNGYWDGYYAGSGGYNPYGFNPYYYNSYDRNSNYGPRGSSDSNNNSASSSGDTYGSYRGKSLGQLYEKQVALERSTLPAMPAGGSGDVNKTNKNSFSDVDKGLNNGKTTNPISPAQTDVKGNGNVQKGNTENSPVDNYTVSPNIGKGDRNTVRPGGGSGCGRPWKMRDSRARAALAAGLSRSGRST